MKNLVKIALVAGGIFTFTAGNAQTHKDSTLGHQIGHAAKKVGHKTAQVAATGAAAVTDKKYDNKRGPHGESIYIDKHSRYFYVNKKGHRVYLKKSQLVDKSES
ncbi:hypothetical protein [Mucilaginibacter sp. L3T2-6]|uniref:hypothetical protein n=1 Tax=Mucilaginibacter sp. L3T2-6 TaxID=3062491 RepID=UPI002676D51A|nr:hypothetical protein [Mucilaginibacter sp. L3T2-6]MDO3640635.1 hypothetical protein [Mucilaginibacter sp. L3T2-6]MDV6213026.1 hypothetical protein [Mucilaginibacter sp. L3T2-6]